MHGNEVLTAHVRACVKHPMRALEAENEALRAEKQERDTIADAAERLVTSLGEYVRQTMHANREWADGIRAVEAALFARKKRLHDNEQRTEDWSTPRRYLTDDRDGFASGWRGNYELVVSMGGNGDWYVSVLPEGHKSGPTVRITTSGQRLHDLVPAIAQVYRALGESK